MVDVVQLVRASDCGSECRGFEPHPPPIIRGLAKCKASYVVYACCTAYCVQRILCAADSLVLQQVALGGFLVWQQGHSAKQRKTLCAAPIKKYPKILCQVSLPSFLCRI